MTKYTYQPDERAGIWIDRKTAYLIKISADHSPVVEKLLSGVKSHDVSPDDEKTHMRLADSGYNKHDQLQHHQNHELHLFYNILINRLKDVDYLYLFGPGEAKLGLNRAIEQEGAHFRCKVAGIDTVDNMTQNQMQEKVRKFFTSLRYEDKIRKLRPEIK